MLDLRINQVSGYENSTQSAFTCSRSTMETTEQCIKFIFIVNYENNSHLVLVFIGNFEHVIAGSASVSCGSISTPF